MAENTDRNLEREQRILDAAMDLIVHYGYDKTTVDDIAREAGVSKGAIYLHFRGKETLFEALVLRESDRIADKLFEQVGADPDGGSIVKIFSYSLLAIAENPLLRALYANDRRVLGDFMRRLRTSPLYQQGFDFGQTFVVQMQTAGLLRQDIPADVMAYIFAIIRFGLLTIDDAIDIKQPPPLEAVTTVITDMLGAVFAPQGGDTKAGKRAFQQLIEYGKAVIKEQRAKREQETG